MEGIIVSEHDKIGEDDEDPSDEGDEVWGDPLGELFDYPLPIGVEKLVDLCVLAWLVFVEAELLESLCGNKIFHR